MKDVFGNDVKTIEVLNRIRKQFEYYINRTSHVTVINTTRGGAAIQGTIYKELDELILSDLTESTVQVGWENGSSNYNEVFLRNRIQDLDLSAKALQSKLLQISSVIQEISKELRFKRITRIEEKFSQLDYTVESLEKDLFFRSIIKPMMKVQIESFTTQIRSVRFEKKLIKKAEIIVNEFTAFLIECEKHYEFALHYYEEMKKEVNY